MIYLFLSNLGRRLAEWADDAAERRGNGKHIIDQMRAAGWLREAAPSAWWKS